MWGWADLLPWLIWVYHCAVVARPLRRGTFSFCQRLVTTYIFHKNNFFHLPVNNRLVVPVAKELFASSSIQWETVLICYKFTYKCNDRGWLWLSGRVKITVCIPGSFSPHVNVLGQGTELQIAPKCMSVCLNYYTPLLMSRFAPYGELYHQCMDVCANDWML